MRKFLATLILSLSLAFGGVALAAPESASANQCEATSYLGDRVCFDKTTTLGPLISIYTAANSRHSTFGCFFTFPIQYTATVGVTPAVGWDSVAPTVIGVTANQFPSNGGGTTTAYFGPIAQGANNVCYMDNSTNVGALQWFSSYLYPNMEWVIVD